MRNEMSQRRAIGILGGTFDPVHCGHIAIAQDFKHHLQLDEMRLVPARAPPHRAQPQASDADRLAMLRLATTNTGLLVDERELQRGGASYTIDTLASLRQELGADTALVLCLGQDAFAQLDTWQRWRELTGFAHIAVATRAGQSIALNPAVRTLLAAHQASSVQALTNSPAGCIALAQLSQIPVSSTQVRQALASTRTSVDVHPDVLHYIQQRGLYSAQ